MESRNFHGTISELINPRPSAVNRESYYENEELQTQIFALSDGDDGGKIVRVNVFRNNGTKAARIDEITMVENLGSPLQGGMMAISTKDSSLFLTGLNADKSLVLFLPEAIYSAHCISAPCAMNRFPKLGLFGSKQVGTGLQYLKRRNSLVIYKTELDTNGIKATDRAVKVFFAKSPDWNHFGEGLLNDRPQKHHARYAREQHSEVASMPEAFEKIVKCIDDAREGSPFVYCAGGGWTSKSFIVRIEIPDVLNALKPTNDWIVLVQLQVLGPFHDIIWRQHGSAKGQKLLATVAAWDGRVIQVDVGSENSCPPPVNRSLTHKFRKFKVDTHLNPCTTFDPVCTSITPPRASSLWSVDSLVQVRDDVILGSVKNAIAAGGRIFTCIISEGLLHQKPSVLRKANFPTPIIEDSAGNVYFFEQFTQDKHLGTFSYISKEEFTRFDGDLTKFISKGTPLSKTANTSKESPPFRGNASTVKLSRSISVSLDNHHNQAQWGEYYSYILLVCTIFLSCLAAFVISRFNRRRKKVRNDMIVCS